MNMIPDKPFKNYDEQLSRLRAHNILIPLNSESFVKSQLSQYGYYNIANAYQNMLPHDLMEHYDPAVSVMSLIQLKWIDEAFSSVLLGALIHFENAFENSLGYHISRLFGVYAIGDDTHDGYLSRSHYPKRNFDPRPTLNRLEEFVTGTDPIHHQPSKMKVSSSILAYRQYHNHVPAWILLNEISLGLAKRWYSICPQEIKLAIIADLLGNTSALTDQEKLKLFHTTLNIVEGYRNGLAHGTSIWKTHVHQSKKTSFSLSSEIVRLIKDSKIISTTDLRSNHGVNDIYAILLILTSETQNFGGMHNILKNCQQIYQQSFENQETRQSMFEHVLEFPSDFELRLERLDKWYSQ